VSPKTAGIGIKQLTVGRYRRFQISLCR